MDKSDFRGMLPAPAKTEASGLENRPTQANCGL